MMMQAQTWIKAEMVSSHVFCSDAVFIFIIIILLSLSQECLETPVRDHGPIALHTKQTVPAPQIYNAELK